MNSSALNSGISVRKLRLLLLTFFVALAVPGAALVWHAYGQLRWESFHNYRIDAEELTRRIDVDLRSMMAAAEARSFADYSFLVFSGESGSGYLQRSPLADFPVQADVTGTLGYFQIDADGEFTTPLLPQATTGETLNAQGFSAADAELRGELAQQIRTILSDNQLVPARSSRVADAEQFLAEEIARLDADAQRKNESGRRSASYPAATAAAQPAESYRARKQKSDYAEAESAVDTQIAFDRLNRSDDYALAQASDSPADNLPTEQAQKRQRPNQLGKVADLNLDPSYERKSAQVEQDRELAQQDQSEPAEQRFSRKEITALAEAEQGLSSPLVAAQNAAPIRITTFESEVDPLEFSMLDSGHLVLFRRVWQEGERYIQGLLLDQNLFLKQSVEQKFSDTALSTISNLIVAYQDEVIASYAASGVRSYASRNSQMQGNLLYRSGLSAPLGDIELIYSLDQLPPGPGASVLGWVTLILGVVLCGGFIVLYRAGLAQMALARQQQDFVSAVSHELKTPITSIRMYAEMLIQGWADEEKKKTYYNYIHDESERLGRLVSNVLQLARITRNDASVELQPVAVGELMDQIASKVTSQVRAAGFELNKMMASDLDQTAIDVDQGSFLQIALNLVDNAIKFSSTSNHKRIDISFARVVSDNQVVFGVRDYGPGIPNDQLRKIFRLFYRSESELTRETTGTGIGLAIVQQLCVAMGARVDVVNRNPGTEFKVSFAASAVSAT